MKKKVLFLCDFLGCGGSERSLISLLSTLDYSIIDVDLLLWRRGGVFEPYVPKEVNIIDFNSCVPRNKLTYALSTKLYSLHLRAMRPKAHLAEVLWKYTGPTIGELPKKYDVAISFQQGYPTFFLATKVNATKKAARVNIDMVHANYDAAFCRKFYDKVDNVIAISEAINQQLQTTDYVTDKSKIFTLFNVFSVDSIRNFGKDNPYDDGFDGLRIATTGRMVEQKGYDLALKAAKILKDQGRRFRWYFVGGGQLQGQIQAMVDSLGLNDYITLLGMQPNPYGYMGHCDIYVQTSRFEGFGRTVTEAKILGRPVVSTNFPSIFDQIRDGENGLICNMTPENIAQSIGKLMDSAELRNYITHAVEAENFTTALTESEKMMRYLTN